MNMKYFVLLRILWGSRSPPPQEDGSRAHRSNRRRKIRSLMKIYTLLLYIFISLLLKRTLAAIASASMTHSTLNGGAQGTVTVAFTTGTDVPIDGTISVVFPAGFTVASTSIASPSGIDAGSTVSSSSLTVTVTVKNAIMSAGAISFVLNAITNPGAGGTGTYTITTKDSGGTQIESNSAVTQNTITTTTLTPATTVPDSTTAGVIGTVTITFTTAVALPIGAKVKITFPSTYTIASDAISSTSNINAASSVAFSGQVVTITIATGATASAAAVSFKVNKVTNPGESTTGTYSISTTDSSDKVFQTSAAISGTSITKTTLTPATAVPDSTSAGVLGTATITFTTSVGLAIGDKVKITFPSTYTIASDAISSTSNINAASTIAFSGQVVTITIASGATTSGAAVSLKVNKVTNPAESTTGTYSISTTDSNDLVYQTSAAITGTSITKTTLSSSSTVVPANCSAGVATTYTITLVPAVSYPVTSKIVVIFPSAYGVATTTVSGHSNIDTATTSVSVSSQTVTITVAGAAITAGTGRAITINGITNPASTCNQYYQDACTTTASAYTLKVTDSSDQIYEDNTAITGSAFIKSALSFARVRTASIVASTATTATVTFDTLVTIPLGGKIKVTFPSGFTLGSVAISSHVGLNAASTSVSVSGQVVTITIAGADLAIANSNSFVLSAITTPTALATGYYEVALTDSSGNVFQDELSIVGEGCLMLNRCNGHGTCTVLSETCICSTGWGASTDIAAYRAPDCSKRTCPSGPSWSTVPTAATSGHAEEECSGKGLCNRETGACECFAGYAGASCQRTTCLNECSGHGQCVSIREMAAMTTALPLSAVKTYKGAESTTTWDEDRVFGCVCDSSWTVGLAATQTQTPEFFGGDCSLRHCPTGNDPMTTADETDCSSVNSGASGNLCHVDCSNRGVCDYFSGVCTCFPGFTGVACNTIEVLVGDE